MLLDQCGLNDSRGQYCVALTSFVLQWLLGAALCCIDQCGLYGCRGIGPVCVVMVGGSVVLCEQKGIYRCRGQQEV